LQAAEVPCWQKTQGCCTIINSFDDELKDGCLAQLVERRPYKA
jgi:hypothetical protein